ALELADLAQVDAERPVGDQLDVVEADHLLTAHVERAEAARGVDDGITERLPHDTAPAEIECAHHLLAGVGGGRAGEPERVGALDAGEVDREICHGILAGAASCHASGGRLAGRGRSWKPESLHETDVPAP